MFGTPAEIEARAIKLGEKVGRCREAIASIEHPPTELVLMRKCCDVGKMVHAMRCNGDLLGRRVTDKFDFDLRTGVQETPGGLVHDTSWWQTTLGTTSGGLGMKSSGDVCLPAFIGSRVAVRALVSQMFKHAEEAGIGIAEDLQQRYDARTRRAVASLKSRLPEETHGDIEQAIAEGGDAAAARWRDAVAGRRSRGSMEDGAGPASARATGRHSAGLVSDAGAEDE